MDMGDFMGFIDNIYKCVGAENFPAEPNFKAMIFGDSAGFFENVTGIGYYTPEEISLRIKKGGVTVRGENLFIKKYCAGDVVICGKITSLERV